MRIIREYPVDGTISARIPATRYSYVAWVGGNKIQEQFHPAGVPNIRLSFTPRRSSWNKTSFAGLELLSPRPSEILPRVLFSKSNNHPHHLIRLGIIIDRSNSFHPCHTQALYLLCSHLPLPRRHRQVSWQVQSPMVPSWI